MENRVGLHVSFPTIYVNDYLQKVKTLYDVCEQIVSFCKILSEKTDLTVYLVLRPGPPVFLAKGLLSLDNVKTKLILPYTKRLYLAPDIEKSFELFRPHIFLVEENIEYYMNTLFQFLLENEKHLVLYLKRGSPRKEQKIVSSFPGIKIKTINLMKGKQDW